MRIITVVLSCFAGALALLPQQAFAQSVSRTVELGAQFTTTKISDRERPNGIFQDINDTLIGGGVRIGYNISPRFAIEAEGNIFRRPSTDQGRRSQGLFGIKIGKRSENIGLFGKLRLGFMRFDRAFSFSATPLISLDMKDNVYLAVDLGGVVEFYPSRRTIIRFDLGDSIIRYSNRRVKNLQPGVIGDLDPYHGHNVQLGIGVGIRF
jgi:hypothetical protein